MKKKFLVVFLCVAITLLIFATVASAGRLDQFQQIVPTVDAEPYFNWCVQQQPNGNYICTKIFYSVGAPTFDWCVRQLDGSLICTKIKYR